ncbi:MAG: hypothetical protein ACR2PR_07980 [Pseudohongiellaceae bacterium]
MWHRIRLRCSFSRLLSGDGYEENIVGSYYMPAFVGCVPVPFKLFYMSFESAPDVEVLAYGKFDLYRTIGDSPMPISYKLTREEYTVLLDTHTESWYPASFLRAESSEGLELKIVPVRNPGSLGYFDTMSTKYHYAGRGMRYVCRGNESCPYENPHNEGQQFIKFTVVDSIGSILGEESIPFTLHRNGIFIENDSI